MTPPNTWDAKPVYKVFGGQTMEVFYRSHLAKALNREQVTIRSLERRGVLCTPYLREKRGRWLYTRDQIEDLIRLADDEGVLDPRYRNSFSQRFINEAHQILSRPPQ